MYVFGFAIGHRVDMSSFGLSYLNFIVPGLMTLHLMSSSYENTTSSLFIARWHSHIQEVLLSPLSYFEMVVGLLAGGVARGVMVCTGIFVSAQFIDPTFVYHPWWLIYFMLTISVTFSCAGMMGALWAEDFGMLNMWGIYVITPLALFGGVFHPLALLPGIIQKFALFNPLYYLIEGVRYSVTNISGTSVLLCAAISLILAAVFFTATIYLFKIGYKLRK